ncbi:LysR family transcriptional regulator [Ruegeria sp. Ofav3-42]|uniref:LysR family transcriptional regulator n=1 Tax=Ruegeria sp. Ofav3-42 TaxID=2917759 RepID=UPI001EF510AD|nr:LysR family transcriptional regulator [Ruegeria sp. Ofav3-42]MCG7522745.1 LysR family transcriptional regulator [Ruegeria sp. Ofav3-42]
MNIKSLRLFILIMEHATLARAAQMLNVSQPAASRLIRLLEEEVGETLFHRTRKRLRPTHEAEIFLPEASRIINAIDNIPEAFAQARADMEPPLRILCLPRIDTGLVAPALAQMDALDRTQKFIVETCPRREFGRRLLHGKFDVGVCSIPIPVENLDVHFLANAPLQVMLPKAHPLTTRDVLTPEDLRNERYISLDDYTVIRQTVDRALNGANTVLEITHEVSSSEVAHVFVRNGMGFTFADPAAVAPELASEVSLVRFSLEADISLAYFLPDFRRPHKARGAFLDLLRDICSDQYGKIDEPKSGVST